MAQNPKKTFTKLNLKRKLFGPFQRVENTLEAFDKSAVFPKPVEYEDIDKAVLDFVAETFELTDSEGKKAPTFTLFSNQRFSEYSQTWQHTDEYGNLLMDFKTVNRDTNPHWGSNQGASYNIPGDRRYTILLKEVMDDNGTESYEVYTMAQPLSVDIKYLISYITGDWHKLNDFNLQLNETFKSLQHYIKPNGHYMPMTLEDVDDQTEYALDNRKIYIQSAVVNVKAIIIPEKSFKIEKFPKRLFTGVTGIGNSSNRKPTVDVEEDGNGRVITIYFPPNTNKTEFTYDELVRVTSVSYDNIRDFSISIDGVKLQNPEGGFTLNDTSTVKVKTNGLETNLPSKITFKGNRL